jgi:two-component system chemotaxis sensor kinase CheA
LSWTIRLVTSVPRAEIEAVFEFVEGDCDLVIREGEPDMPTQAPTVEDTPALSFASFLNELAPTPPVAPAEAPSFADFAAELGIGAQPAPTPAKAAPADSAGPAAASPASGSKDQQVSSIRVELDNTIASSTWLVSS